MIKHCVICGKEFTSSPVALIGESDICTVCRKIKDKAILRAIISLSKQVENLTNRIIKYHKKEILDEQRNSKIPGQHKSEQNCK